MLRILIVLNWLLAVAVLILLFVMPHEHWLMVSLKLTPGPEATRIVWGMRGIAVGERHVDLVFQRTGSQVVAYTEGDDAGAVPIRST